MVGSKGYTVKFNRYGGPTTNCGGNLLNGQAQRTVSINDAAGGKKMTDVSKCAELCNKCALCAGFMDLIKEKECHFLSKVENKLITFFSALAIRRKYYDNVRSYSTCPAGTWSQPNFSGCNKCKASPPKF